MTETTKKYIVVNIGCIECGVSSNIVGVFSDEEVANEIANRLTETMGWRESGQNEYEVFEMPEINVINPEYFEGLK